MTIMTSCNPVPRGISIFLTAWLSAACVGEDLAGEGDLALEVSGGAALREGFPYTEGSATYEFVDGWELQFEEYVIVVDDVFLSEQDDSSEVERWEGPEVMDLAAGGTGSEELTTIGGLPARRLDFGFSIVAPSEVPAESSASEDVVQMMIDNGWSFYTSGEAVHPATSRTIRFEFGLPVEMLNYECINGKDTTKGVSIEANKTTGAFIYAHAIHLFWDTLSSGDEDLRFEAFAAVAGDDDVVTEEELKAQDLTDLRDADGEPLVDDQGHPVVYNDGGLLPPDEWTLYHFLKYAFRASTHFNGVGLCKVRDL